MGDTAEHRFQEWAATNGMQYAVYGLRRPNIPVYYLPPFVRYTPDFVVRHGLMEVQGCGRDQTIKLKHDKLWALKEWNKSIPVYMWLWNQTWDQIGVTNMDTIFDLTLESARTDDLRIDGLFDGDKPYASIRWDMLMDHPGTFGNYQTWSMFIRKDERP
jgi:hypothetical protein